MKTDFSSNDPTPFLTILTAMQERTFLMSKERFSTFDLNLLKSKKSFKNDVQGVQHDFKVISVFLSYRHHSIWTPLSLTLSVSPPHSFTFLEVVEGSLLWKKKKTKKLVPLNLFLFYFICNTCWIFFQLTFSFCLKKNICIFLFLNISLLEKFYL